VKIVNIIIYSSFLTSNTEQEIYFFDGDVRVIFWFLVLTISNGVDFYWRFWPQLHQYSYCNGRFNWCGLLMRFYCI